MRLSSGICERFATTSSIVLVCPLGSLESGVHLVDVSLVVLVVMNAHRRLVDVGLESVVLVGEGRYLERHLDLLRSFAVRTLRVLLVSWNVAGRKTRLQEQADRMLALEPDLVCLQEVAPLTAEPWLERLAEAGLGGALAPLPKAREGSRPLAVLTAARGNLEILPVGDVPWRERVLAVQADWLEVVNVHSPISPKPGLAKVLTHEAVFRHVRKGAGPRVVLGDLNTPRREHPDGSVWTFARNRNGRLRPERGERWDAAETALIRGLEPSGFRDAFRELNGFGSKEPTWEWPRTGGGYRLDHLIVSAGSRGVRVRLPARMASRGQALGPLGARGPGVSAPLGLALRAAVAELADAPSSGGGELTLVEVRLLSSAWPMAQVGHLSCYIRHRDAPPGGSAAAHHAADGCHQLLGALFLLRVRTAHDAVVRVVVEQAEGHLVERGLSSADLRQDVDAVAVVLDHPLDAAHLALDAAQPLQELVLGRRVAARLACCRRAHAATIPYTPRGYATFTAMNVGMKLAGFAAAMALVFGAAAFAGATVGPDRSGESSAEADDGDHMASDEWRPLR